MDGVMKEQRKEIRNLNRVEKSGEYLTDITINSHQIDTITTIIKEKCKENGDTINLSEVIKILTDNMKLILEKKQTQFIASHGIRMTLKNENVIIRPVAPSDRQRLVEGLQKLSSDTLFLRFLSPTKELSASQVDYLINVDFEDHVAYAVVKDEPNFPGMAVTRYIRDYTDRSQAEWAVTVVDAYQGLGIGRILLYLMTLVAYKHGIRVFTASIHPTNIRVLKWMEEIGADSVNTEDGLIWRFSLPIPESFMNKESIRNELARIVDGSGTIPQYVAADMKKENYEKMMTLL